MTDKVPTAKLELRWPEGIPETEETRDEFNERAAQRMQEFAQALRGAGERPWFEVWYVGFPGRPDLDENSFDAVEVAEDGTITNLPPYSELEAAS